MEAERTREKTRPVANLFSCKINYGFVSCVHTIINFMHHVVVALRAPTYATVQCSGRVRTNYFVATTLSSLVVEETERGGLSRYCA